MCGIISTAPQLTDMVTNATQGSILSIDRTFNVGPHYVTSITYKNMKINNRDYPYENPLFLGPIFLHRQAIDDDYAAFLLFLKNSIASKYPDFDFSQLVIVSDQEKALTKAIDAVFEDSLVARCYLHIKKNISHWLDKVTLDHRDKDKIKGYFHCLIMANNATGFQEFKDRLNLFDLSEVIA